MYTTAITALQTILTGASWDGVYNFTNFNNNVHIYGLLQLGNIANVETVLSGLSSTYATISSLSSYATISSLSSYLTTATASSTYATITSLADYVKTSVANTFTAKQTFNAGIGLNSATISAPTANMIGYQMTSKYATTTIANGTQTFGSLTLSPIGSVWIVNANIVPRHPNFGMTLFDFSVQVGATYAYTDLTTLQTIGRFVTCGTPSGYTSASTLCGTYTVETGKQTICYGAVLNTSQTSLTIVGACMTATRIA